MSSGLYVALSAQVALERRLTSIANNVANANTTGYRAEEVKFDSVLAAAGDGNRIGRLMNGKVVRACDHPASSVRALYRGAARRKTRGAGGADLPTGVALVTLAVPAPIA